MKAHLISLGSWLLFLLHFFSINALFSAEVHDEKLIGKIIKNFMHKNKIPGMVVAYYVDGREGVLAYGYADKSAKILVTPQTIFELASITKIFTSIELVLQAKNGVVKLDDKLSVYLPKIDPDKGAINQITLKQLATHTSSLPRTLPPLKNGLQYTYPMMIAFLQNWKPAYPIGTHYLYSNLGFGLLGLALENIVKKPYASLIAADILNPLGMSSTFIDVPISVMSRYAKGYAKDGKEVSRSVPNLLPASGALRSTGDDMLKFLKAVIIENIPKKLKEAIQITEKSYFKVNEHLTLGLAWQRFAIKEEVVLDKNGGLPGFSSYIGMIDGKQIGIVILANRTRINSTRLGRNVLLRLSKQRDGESLHPMQKQF